MSHLQYTAKSHHLQWNMKQLSKICHQLYRDYCPDSLKHRHNVSLSKVSDESLLVLLLLQAELRIKSQRHFHRICQLFPCGRLLERSRFNRRSRQLIWLLQLIRQAMNNQISSDTIAIVDSFPYHFVSLFVTIEQVFSKDWQTLATMRQNTYGSMVSKFTYSLPYLTIF